MFHREITPTVVASIDRLLGEGITHATIAAQLGISRYVVRVIAHDAERDVPAPPQRIVARRVPNSQKGIDATTIRMIQRMLAVRWLPHVEIAREAGVSDNTVSDVASGKRPPISTWMPYLQKGERFLPEPVRCSVCRAMISIVPCRACCTRREARAGKSV